MLRATSSSVSRISSSFVAVPQPAKMMTSSVMTEKKVTMRSKTLNGYFQNDCVRAPVSGAGRRAATTTTTYPAKGNEADDDLENHRGVNDELEYVESEPRAAVLQAEHDCRDRERGHGEVEHDVDPRVHEAVRQAACDLPARERVHRARRSRSAQARGREQAGGRGDDIAGDETHFAWGGGPLNSSWVSGSRSPLSISSSVASSVSARRDIARPAAEVQRRRADGSPRDCGPACLGATWECRKHSPHRSTTARGVGQRTLCAALTTACLFILPRGFPTYTPF
jgi:hypothetical protein